MIRPFVAAACFAAGSPLVAQDKPPVPAPPPPAPTAPAAPAAPAKGDEKKPDAPPVVVDDVGNAAKIAQQQEKPLADKDAKVRAEALALFASHRNESYVKLIAPLLHDKNDEVAKVAVAALGNQPFAPATDALLNYACDDKKGAPNDALRLAAIKALGDTGIGKKGYDRLKELFATVDDDTKEQIFATLAKSKEKRAFSFFVDHFDQPNDTSANRPPTAVLKKNFDSWNKCKGTLRKGLRDMTGEGFPTAKQYIEWAKGPGQKLGFVYEHGK